MSTQKNEHNPDNLSRKQVGEGWRILGPNERQQHGDEWWNDVTNQWEANHEKDIGRRVYGDGTWYITYRRRITPPTDTTGPVIDTKFVCRCGNRSFGMHEPMCPLGKADLTGCPNHFADGSKIFPNRKCCDDTTGSGREGETAKQRTEQDEVLWQSFLKAFIAEFPSKPIYDTDSCRYYVRFAAIFAERRLAAALAQVEALRRDGERLDWLETKTVNVRVPLVHGSRDLFWSSPEDQDGGNDLPSDIRAAIDSAQRQEGA